MLFIQGICPGLRLLVMFRKQLTFYVEELLAAQQNPKLEDYPLSVVNDCLFIIFSATLPSAENIS
jgi:hypothetical protein